MFAGSPDRTSQVCLALQSRAGSKLAATYNDPIQLFKFTPTIRIRGVQGGEIVTQVYALTEQGSPFVREYGRSLLPRVCVPLFRFILKWIQEGALDDPHGEFFVSASSHPDDAPSGRLPTGTHSHHHSTAARRNNSSTNHYL